MPIDLRPYQTEDVGRLRAAYLEGARAVLYVLPSGGGLFPPQVKQIRHPDLRDALMLVAQNRNGKLDPVRFGYWLRKVRDRVIALTTANIAQPAERVALVDAGERHRGVVAWKLETR